jgi:hypothetical protein
MILYSIFSNLNRLIRILTNNIVAKNIAKVTIY